MIIKTKKANFTIIENFIKKNSGYEIPEIVAISPQSVNKPYLNWINSEVE